MAQLLLLPMTTFLLSSSEGKKSTHSLPWDAVAFLKPEEHFIPGSQIEDDFDYTYLTLIPCLEY